MSATRDWDAATYDRVANPQARWGAAVVDRLPLAGDETVLDAGAGSGRVTELLAERLPKGRVIALDGSPSMIAEARRRLSRFGDRVEYVVADLSRPFTLPDGVVADAILSTATFHWILDHDALFRRLFDALRPGGRLVAQCGGRGNIAATLDAAAEVAAREPYAAALGGMPDGWLFAGPEDTVARLEAAGFEDAGAELIDAPAEFDRESVDFLATVVLRHHLEVLEPALRAPYAEEVTGLLRGPGGRVVLDYVRLNMEAWRPAR